jgi:homoserine/homoserine lactone efflux protein
MSFQIWLGFMLACWAISISPGAGAIASMSSGLNYGFRHGYSNAIGLQLALALQILIVAAELAYFLRRLLGISSG